MTEIQKNWWEIDESRPYGFISYAHHDRKTVDPVAYQLIRDGYPVWMDHDIVSGADWSEYIADHLKNASYVIIFLSQASIRSGNVRDEINFARNEGKHLIVVYLEDVSQIMPKGLHLSLDRFQAIDAYSHSFEDTVHALEGAITFRRNRTTASVKKKAQTGQNHQRRTTTNTRPVRQKKKSSKAPLAAGIAAIVIVVALLIGMLFHKTALNTQTADQVTATPETTQETQNNTQQQPVQNEDTPQNTQKNVSDPAENTTDYTFSSAVLSSRFGMSADDFRSFVAQQGTDVSGLNTDNGNVVLSLTDDQKNTLIQTLENNATSAASRPSGDITSASYDNGYTGLTIVLSSTEVSGDDQSAADTLKAYGILINVLNDSSSTFKVTFNDAQGNLISTETY